MSSETMTKDGQFIVIPNRSWGKVTTWNKPSSCSGKMESSNSDVSFVDIMNEQMAEKMEEEEFENYIKNEYVTMSNDFVNLESDQQYSVLLKSCLDKELNLHVLELDEEDDSEEEALDYPEETAYLESSFFTKINEYLSKQSTKCQDVKRKRVRDRTKSQSEFDAETRMTLYKFMQKSILKDNYGVVNKGKKSLVLHAHGGMKKTEKGEPISLPKECAIKVFKAQLPMTETKDCDKTSPPSPISSSVWAHREFQNLKRMEKAGIPCPKVQFVKKNVLVMDFVGKEGKAAWKLRDFPFSNEIAIKTAYDQVIHSMKTMYKTCHLVHADLSEKSILWWNNQCYFTDAAHALEAGSNDSYVFLYRNCRNIIEFFAKKGLTGTHTMDSLFIDITGFEYPGLAVETLKL